MWQRQYTHGPSKDPQQARHTGHQASVAPRGRGNMPQRKGHMPEGRAGADGLGYRSA